MVGLIADTSSCHSMFNFLNMLKFSKANIIIMAERTLNRHKKQIASGSDADGNAFEQYSKSYAKRKKGGQRTPVTLKDTGKMLKAFQVLKADYKSKELKFRYGTKANKQGIKMNEHNDGAGRLKVRKIAEDQALGRLVENGIVEDFANQIGNNLQRMTKTKHLVKL